MSTPTIERKVTDADMQRPVLCHLHPRYMARSTPRVPCPECWDAYIDRQLTLHGRRPLAKRICTALLRGVR